MAALQAPQKNGIVIDKGMKLPFGIIQTADDS
jgi:hypothetical protein